MDQFYNEVVIIRHFWVTTFFRGLKGVNYFTRELQVDQTKYFRDGQRKCWSLTLKTKSCLGNDLLADLMVLIKYLL